VDGHTPFDDPRTARALAHPTRLRLVALLGEREASTSELAKVLDAPVGRIAHHVRALRAAGLIEQTRETRVRGATQRFYRSVRRPLVTDEGWGASDPLTRQVIATGAIDSMLAYARAAAGAGGFDRADVHVTRTLMRVDDEGFRQLAAAFAALLEQVGTIEQAAAERLEDSGEAGLDAGLGLLLFEATRLLPPLPPAD
jgi:DNA-binding transcriptional ArsR family regulator